VTYKFGWFSTGRDPAARELLTIVHDKIREGFIPGELVFVFCSREPGEAPESDEFIKLVESYNLPLICFSSKKFKPELFRDGKNDPGKRKQWRNSYDEEVARLLEGFEHDADVLAGYMLIVSEMLCKRFSMVNLHPARPDGPKGTWQEVIWELIETRARVTGVMMHLVTEELDRGPPITYCSFPIRGGKFESLWEQLENKLKTQSVKEIENDEGEDEPYFKLVREQGVLRELPLIIFTLRSLAERKVYVEMQKVFSGGESIAGGYDLTQQIEKCISE
jgi:phosphoribosylglycinamide formyltransferase-1